MKMKRKNNKRLLGIALLLVLFACAIGAIGAACGSVIIKTKGTPSENIKNLFDAIISGDDKACLLCTDSYRKINFDASNESDVVSALCGALRGSYSYEQHEALPGENRSLSSENTISFSSLNLPRLSEAIAGKYKNHLAETAKEYGDKATAEDGKYVSEVYEKAYARAVSDALEDPKSYYKSETITLRSSYHPEAGNWRTAINETLADMLRGGLQNSTSPDQLSVPETVRIFVEDSIAALKGEPVQKRTKYSLSSDSAVAPKPDASLYGSVPTDQAIRIVDIIAKARACGLLGDQQMLFNPEADFYPEDIKYYFDDSILVICWKEYINGCVCNCMEVKLADGSQIRRKLTDDKYDSGKLDTVSNMSAATNAVSAMSADYYAFRDIGITVYRSELCRYQLSCEVLMIDDKGKFIFYYPDGKTADELQQYIREKNIRFSLAFGPVLIDNYKPRYYTDGYAFGLGEMKECYSRAAFGEYDDLHYLFMTSGYSEKTVPPADLNAFIEILRTKNLKNVYNLDGGQTAEIVLQNKPYNKIDYGGERQVSDMVYFVTAVSGNKND